MGIGLQKIFDSFDKRGIFKDKEILQTRYKPENIPHRSEQIRQMASILVIYFYMVKQEQVKHFLFNLLVMKF